LLPAGDNVATATAIAQECGILPPLGVSMADWLAQQAAITAATRSGGGWLDTHAPATTPVTSGSSLLASGSPLASWSGMTAGSAEALLPEGVVMKGSEFRQRVLLPDGSINAGAPPSRSLHALPAAFGHHCACVLPPRRGRMLMCCSRTAIVTATAAATVAEEFLQLWPRLRVLARCTPADKYTIVTGERVV
jgi:magnesium-transporting ATPase (P-type)